jgi:uncharacterized protein YxeA
MEKLETSAQPDMGASTNTEPSKPSGSSNKNVLIAAVAVVLVVIIAAVAVVYHMQQNTNTGIGYATEAQVLITQEDLDKAAAEAEANAANGDVALSYQNDAFSEDGTNFECRILNSSGNKFDMFLTIYSDLNLTDELFLSQLVPPGSGFENITLEHPLDAGDHTVYVVLTQVKTNEETGEEEVANQVIHTMEFHVEK